MLELALSQLQICFHMHVTPPAVVVQQVGYTIRRSLFSKDRVKLLSGVTAALYPGEMAALVIIICDWL